MFWFDYNDNAHNRHAKNSVLKIKSKMGTLILVSCYEKIKEINQNSISNAIFYENRIKIEQLKGMWSKIMYKPIRIMQKFVYSQVPHNAVLIPR